MQHGTTPDAMEELMSVVRNVTALSLTSFNSHVGKGSSTQDVIGDLMSKLWMFDVVAVGNNSSQFVAIFAEKKVENLDAISWMLLLTGR